MVGQEVDLLSSRQAFYMRIYRQCFSPNGKLLVTADSLARLCLFELNQALKPNASNDQRQLKGCIMCSEPVYAMTTVQSLLVCGDAVGQLTVYSWEDMSSCDRTSQAKSLCSISGFPSNISVAPPNEINALACITGSLVLYSGAGDNAVRLIDIECPNKVISTFAGHSEYVNELAIHSENVFLSASEDGTVRLWDRRSKQVYVFNVAAEEKLKRNNFGRGVCALDVCGGDVDLAIWHISSRSVASILSSGSSSHLRHTVVKMNGSRILTGGNSEDLMQFDYAGQHFSSVKTSLRSIYSIETNLAGVNGMTTVAGDSHLIDVFLNLGYVSFSFSSISV